jgi:Uncharacterized protein conserved in bacteria, COG2343
MQYLRPNPRRSVCEWKGQAHYYDLVVGSQVVPAVAWSYPQPTAAFAPIRDYLAFYAGKLQRCLVAGEMVRPQPGGFYGGWITANLLGPFKGEPGSWAW